MNPQKYVLSIHCITYNQSAFIKDAMDGFAMQQTNFPYVAVVIDDASTDGEREVIKTYIEVHFGHSVETGYKEWETEDAYWIFARHKENNNCHFVAVLLKRNLYKEPEKKSAVTKDWMDAKYIAFCEGDDYWTDTLKLQKQVDYLEEHDEVGLCYTDYSRFNETTNELIQSLFEKQRQYRPTSYEQHLLRPGYLAPMTWVYRKELLSFLDKKKIFLDWSYMCMLEWFYNSKVGYLPFDTSVYRSHRGSASSPIGAKKMFDYYKGVFDTQSYYANKYACSAGLLEKIMVRGYFEILPIAVLAENEGFIEEAQAYLEEKGYDVGLIIRELKEGKSVRESYAYRLGKAIVSPFARLNNRGKRC